MRIARTRWVKLLKVSFAILATGMVGGVARGQATSGSALVPADYQRMRSVAQAAISPDGKFVAYTVLRYDKPGRPWPQLWVFDVASGKSRGLVGSRM